MTLEELILWGTIGLLLSAVGYSLDSWQFWCFMGTYWAVSWISRQRGRIDGMIDFLELDEQDQEKLRRALEAAKEDMK